jgi:hypothetical protein
VAPNPKPASDVQHAVDRGIIPPDAEVIVNEGDTDPEFEPEPESVEELIDAEWLEQFPARKNLSDRCRAWFDADALAFRHTHEYRKKYRTACRPLTNAMKKQARGHLGQWMSRHFYYLRVEGPGALAGVQVVRGDRRSNTTPSDPTNPQAALFV